jgi:glycerol uptake facilitator-like aquaporin
VVPDTRFKQLGVRHLFLKRVLGSPFSFLSYHGCYWPAIPPTFVNLISEIIGTFVIVLGILAIGANKFADGLNPLIVGFLIVSISLSIGATIIVLAGAGIAGKNHRLKEQS